MGLAFALLVWLAAGIAVWQGWRRAQIWRMGAPAPVDWLGGLAAMPMRYLRDVHGVVERDPVAAQMHMAAAGGLLGASVMTALAVLPGLAASALFWLADGAFFALALTGAWLAGRRRSPRPARLSGGSFALLPVCLAAYAIGGLLLCLALALGIGAGALPALALAACGLLSLAAMAATGAMRHPIAGALHLAAHPRPERFGGGRSAGLTPINVSANRLGAETPGDFAWNRLLGFDACVQCGRCEVACPAFAAGQPLNPKRLIQDLVRAMERGFIPSDQQETKRGFIPSDQQETKRFIPSDQQKPPRPDADAGGGGADSAIVGAGGVIHPDTLWSCTTCRACVEECPMMIEHVDAIIDLRRHQTLALGAAPEKAAPALDEMRLADEPGGRPLSARGDFAAGIGLPVVPPGGETDVLLWLGDAAYDLRSARTLRALLQLLHKAGVRFATLGAEERDCGDLARRLGDEATFQRLARENIAALATRRFGNILTADPHALNALRNDYPAMGGHFAVVHHTEFLAGLVSQGRLKPKALAGLAVTYHDPCYLARWNGETDAPRALLAAMGVPPREMARSGRRTMCCGGGGGAAIADIPGERRIPDMRIDQARATGAGIVAVACPNCTAMLEGVPAPRPEILDVAELLLRAVEEAA
jgi:N,N-dimethylglycine/sarcosine dehydrogenase ferredoxin subunit